MSSSNDIKEIEKSIETNTDESIKVTLAKIADILEAINIIKEELCKLPLDPCEREYIFNSVLPLLDILIELGFTSSSLASSTDVLNSTPLVNRKKSKLKDTLHLSYKLNDICKDIYKVLTKRINLLLANKKYDIKYMETKKKMGLLLVLASEAFDCIDPDSSTISVLNKTTERLIAINTINREICKLPLNPCEREFIENSIAPLTRILGILSSVSFRLSNTINTLSNNQIVNRKKSKIADTINLIYSLNDKCEDVYKALKIRIKLLLSY